MSSDCDFEPSVSKRASGKRPKRKRFQGNRYVKKVGLAVTRNSASAKKLRHNSKLLNVNTDATFQGYRLMDISIFIEKLQNVLCCMKCSSKITIKDEIIYGLSSKITVDCDTCGEICTFRNSKMIGEKKNIPEINRRSIYAMRCIGQGISSLRTFCCIMDLPPPISQKAYDQIVHHMLAASALVAKKSMYSASQDEICLTKGSRDICISGDGSWKTRGHTSQIGVCTIIGAESGKVLDTEVLSTFCKGCISYSGKKCGPTYEKWQLDHDGDCTKNHVGSAGKMEVSGMLRIFNRSEDQYNVRYKSYIGDGDAKTFLAITNAKPYGDKMLVSKIECCGHVQKRMGSRLRKKKIEFRGKKLSDNKTISGKGRLTETDINQMTTYYGNAIRANKDSLTLMRKAVWAVYYHKISNDENPIHDFCPAGPASWCKYQNAVHENSVDKFNHKHSLPLAVMEAIKPVFYDLSHPQLLKRCLGGRTQNTNESLNSTIWKYCPKSSGSTRNTVEIAVNIATIIFNGGKKGLLEVSHSLGLLQSNFSTKSATSADKKRISGANRQASKATFEARRAAKRRKINAAQVILEKEGVDYDGGGF